jgi:hypothetical protein
MGAAPGDAVVTEVPMPVFLHQKNVVDTLGYDQPEHHAISTSRGSKPFGQRRG